MSQRVAIYARVSTLHSQNPEMQLAELREYSIQQHDTKMAALEALETPSFAPIPPEPTAPAQHLASPDPKPQGAATVWEDARAQASCLADDKPTKPERPLPEGTQTAIQMEIDRLRAEVARLADRQFALALQERSSAPQAPDTPRRKQRTSRNIGSGPREDVLYRRRSAAKLITFPNPQSA